MLHLVMFIYPIIYDGAFYIPGGDRLISSINSMSPHINMTNKKVETIDSKRSSVPLREVHKIILSHPIPNTQKKIHGKSRDFTKWF